jgi:hypothetical protein
VAIYASPFTGQQQVYQHPGQFLTASIELPPMDRASAADFVAAMLSLQGIRGTFYFGDPAWTSPRGVGTGLPLIKGANQTGNTIATDGWTLSQSPILKAGDWLQIGSMNRLLHSQDFANAYWTKTGITRSAGSTPPNGTGTADLLTEDGATSPHRLERATTATVGEVVTLSVYVKRGTGTRHAQLGLTGSTAFARVYFDLTSGTVANAASGTGTIEALPDDWYRLTASGRSDSATPTVFIASAATTIAGGEVYAGDSTSSLLWWGAQLEKGAYVHAYQVTTSAAVETAPQLSCVVQDASSDGSGDATLELVPRVRTAFAANTPITVVNPWGLWRMTDDGSFLQDVDSLTRGIVINAVEAF